METPKDSKGLGLLESQFGFETLYRKPSPQSVSQGGFRRLPQNLMVFFGYQLRLQSSYKALKFKPRLYSLCFGDYSFPV